jgi:hypothetical protein
MFPRFRTGIFVAVFKKAIPNGLLKGPRKRYSKTYKQGHEGYSPEGGVRGLFL